MLKTLLSVCFLTLLLLPIVRNFVRSNLIKLVSPIRSLLRTLLYYLLSSLKKFLLISLPRKLSLFSSVVFSLWTMWIRWQIRLVPVYIMIKKCRVKFMTPLLIWNMHFYNSYLWHKCMSLFLIYFEFADTVFYMYLHNALHLLW